MLFSKDENFQALLIAADIIYNEQKTGKKKLRQSFLSDDATSKENIESRSQGSHLIDSRGFLCQTHNNKKLFFCKAENCPVSFPTLSRIARHYIIHTGIKPYLCLRKACGRSFSRKDNMMQHYRNFCLNKENQGED
ncbi:Zinc finger C2H2 protein [Cucumispora dikerogammari]|nr:Zinc finger C2H2 protein [Cucumispora dikerogammari]